MRRSRPWQPSLSGLQSIPRRAKTSLSSESSPCRCGPTLLDIDPSTERVALKWPGSATASELALLVGRAALDGGSNNEATAAWLRGNRAVGEAHPEIAVTEYQGPAALVAGGTRPGRDCRSLRTQLQALEEPRVHHRGGTRVGGALTGDIAPQCRARGSRLWQLGAQECIARDELGALAREATAWPPNLASPFSRTTARLSSRARELPEMERAEPRGRRSWRSAGASSSSGSGASRDPGGAGGLRFTPGRSVPRARSARTRAPHARAKRTRFPDDYNTPSRLAKVHLALGRLDLARAAIERAESRVYGPRKLRVAWLKADILVAMEKPKEAKQVLALAAGRWATSSN